MTRQNSKTICILGMHRSGTSCLTGTLEQFGLYLGKVINQAPHNKKGNKENSRLWDINDALLQFNGGAWDSPPQSLVWNQSLELMRDQFLQSYEENAVWGFKDPRCVLTLPFWVDGVPNISLVGTYRHPIAVAKSLYDRNNFSLEQSLTLWLDYNKRILGYHKATPFPIVCFDWEPDKYRQATTLLAKSFGFDIRKTNQEMPFYDSSLIHQVSMLNDSDQLLPEECTSVYENLMRISDQGFKLSYRDN